MAENNALAFDPILRARDRWEAEGWAVPDVMAAVTSITRVHQLLMARIDAVLRPFDLTFARYELLVILTFSRTGALALSRVGERLQVSPASVTNAVDRLSDSGFVRREPHPEDGRATLAVITPEGRAVIRSATRALEEARFGADGLSDAGAKEVFAILESVRSEAGDFSA